MQKTMSFFTHKPLNLPGVFPAKEVVEITSRTPVVRGIAVGFAIEAVALLAIWGGVHFFHTL